ncbi:MAG: FAD binding domain-containing protein, partial [Nitrospinota bacterium]
SLEPDELLKEVRVPDAGVLDAGVPDAGVPDAGGACAYRKVAQRASGFAVVGIAVQLSIEGGACAEAGVGVTGLAGHAYRASKVEEALRGRALDGDAVEAAASKVADGVDPLEDLFASKEYRTHLARVHCRRAIQAALA